MNIRNDLPERTYPSFITFEKYFTKSKKNPIKTNKKPQAKTKHKQKNHGHTTTYTLNKKTLPTNLQTNKKP